MRYAIGLVILLYCVIAGSAAANAEKRVALVIGNASYKAVAPLPNPKKDARDVAAALRAAAFTEVVDPDTSAAILAHVSRAAGRHLALVVTLRDLDLEEVARTPVRSAADAYRRAAAEELLHGREQALAMLRRRGVSVLDAPPSGVTAALVDRYLDLKARARI